MKFNKYLLDKKSLVKTFNIDYLDINFGECDVFCVDIKEPFHLNENIKNISSNNLSKNIVDLKLPFSDAQILNEIKACLFLDLIYVVYDKSDVETFNNIKGLDVISYDEFKKKF